MRKGILAIAVVMAMVTSVSFIGLQNLIGGSQDSNLDRYDDVQSADNQSNPAALPPPNPRRSWIDGPLLNDFKKDIDNKSFHINYSAGAIVFSGKKVGGDMTIKVHSVWVRGTLKVIVKDNEVGGNLAVNVDGNPFVYDLIVKVEDNIVGDAIYVSTMYNAVSNLDLAVGGNEACFDLEVRANNNFIDFGLTVGVVNNTVTSNMLIEVVGNIYPPGWTWLFKTMDVNIENNHVVRLNLKIYIQGNRMAKKPPAIPRMHLIIKENGAGTDLWINILDNKADPKGKIEIEIKDNASDNLMQIMVMGNKAFEITVDVWDNTACVKITVLVQQDAKGQNKNNVEKCLQSVAPDSDRDGLTDKYEQMVGLNSSTTDTDGDGLLDGWWDKNRNMKYDRGELYGEVGDPGAELKFTGSIGFLADVNHDANPICADIYIEVDYTKGHGVKNLPSGSVTAMTDIFKKHRIKMHIDNGWGNDAAGGGQKLPANCVKKNKAFFFYYDRRSGAKNDQIDFKRDPNYFNPDRKDIFHYVVIAPYIAYYDQTKGWVYDKKVTARAEMPGDDILMSYKRIKDFIKRSYPGNQVNKETPNVFAKTLMHELGHNMLLPDTYLKTDEPLTVMYGRTSVLKPLDYKPVEWRSIYPSGILSPQDPD